MDEDYRRVVNTATDDSADALVVDGDPRDQDYRQVTWTATSVA